MKWWQVIRNWRVSARLRLGFGLTLSLLVIVTLVAVFALQNVRGAQGKYESALVLLQKCDRVTELSRLDLAKSRAIVLSVGMPEVADKFRPEILVLDGQIDALLKDLSTQADWDIATHARLIANLQQAYLRARDHVLHLTETGQTIEAVKEESTALLPIANRLSDVTNQLRLHVQSRTDVIRLGVERATVVAISAIITLSVIAFAVGLLVSILIERSVGRKAVMAMRLSEAIARGHLSNEIPAAQTRDEFGRMLASLSKMRAGMIQLHDDKETAVISSRAKSEAPRVSRRLQHWRMEP